MSANQIYMDYYELSLFTIFDFAGYTWNPSDLIYDLEWPVNE